MVVLLDPKLVKSLLAAEHYGDFSKGRSYRIAAPLIGNGLLALPDSPAWRMHRKLAAAAVMKRRARGGPAHTAKGGTTRTSSSSSGKMMNPHDP